MTPLANHVWQSTLFAAAVWLLMAVLRRNHASAHGALWTAASAKSLVPFSLFVGAGHLVEWRVKPAPEWTTPLTAPLVEIGASFPARPSAPRERRKPPNLVEATLWVVWRGGAALGAISWARQCRRACAAISKGSALPLGLPIRAVSIKERWAPGVFGVFRPTLLLPEDIGERERACDEAVALAKPSRTYADTILRVCRWYVAAPRACMAGAGGPKLKKRVPAIVMERHARPLEAWKRGLVGGAAALAVAGPFAVGASAIRSSLGEAL